MSSDQPDADTHPPSPSRRHPPTASPSHSLPPRPESLIPAPADDIPTPPPPEPHHHPDPLPNTLPRLDNANLAALTIASGKITASDDTRPRVARSVSTIPIAFPPLFFQPNASSATLIQSTAEGRPIPVDDSTAADRTLALRQLNTHYPSRHRYAKSTGAQSTTYSRPVIVRTYPGPPNHHHHHHSDAGVSSPARRRAPPSSSRSTGAASVVRRIIPFSSPSSSSGTANTSGTSGSGGQRYGMLSIARAKAKRRQARDPARLPPVEAFTFKSFMTSIEHDPASGGDPNHSIMSDLDRIAEICARSRYSLSNQYEVHKAPHGSGESFLASVSPPPSSSTGNNGKRDLAALGPTLQAVSSDDERQMTGNGRHRRRGRGMMRRRSVAVGTLETIMSSSRSSEEDKSKKGMSAAEIADEVRGRAAARRSASGSCSPESPVSALSAAGTGGPMDGVETEGPTGRRKSVSLASALIENTRHHHQQGSSSAGDIQAASALLSEPARPETSTNYFEVLPAADEPAPHGRKRALSEVLGAPHVEAKSPTAPSSSTAVPGRNQGNIFSSLAGWMAWRGGSEQGPASPGTRTSHAEGCLRELLKSAPAEDKTSSKGKDVDRSF